MVNNPLMQCVQQIAAQLRGAQNPMQFMMQNYAANNPAFGRILQDIQGKTPAQIKQYTRNRAKASNFDLEEFFKQTGLR